MNKKRAFTLAEVLITLTIIGVIAALTIPNLMRKWEDQATISGVKEAASIFGNAMKMAIRENNALITDWNWPSQKRENYFAEQIMPYLKVKKYCGNDTRHHQLPDCHSYVYKSSSGAVNFKSLNGSLYAENPNTITQFGGQMMLENGMTVAIKVRYPKGATSQWRDLMYSRAKDFVGYILVDINGKKGPNQLGIDYFVLPFGGNGLMIDRDLHNLNSSNIDIAVSKSSCYNKNSIGLSCATWILLHNNVDYKYRDVRAEW